MAQTYAQQLKDPRWQKRRLERLNAARFSCENCGDETTELHVHHPEYFRGRKAWEYEDDELEVLCKPCHSKHHELEQRLKQARSVSPMGHAFLDGIQVGFLECGLDIHASDDVIDAVCPDGRICGAVAYMFFYCRGTTKAKIMELLRAEPAPRNPAEEEFLSLFGEA